MSEPTVDNVPIAHVPRKSAPIVPAADPVPRTISDELESIARVLACKFPEIPGAAVREVVESTYLRLARTARIHSHLIPLTLNLSRSRLASIPTVTSGQSTDIVSAGRPRMTDDSPGNPVVPFRPRREVLRP